MILDLLRQYCISIIFENTFQSLFLQWWRSTKELQEKSRFNLGFHIFHSKSSDHVQYQKHPDLFEWSVFRMERFYKRSTYKYSINSDFGSVILLGDSPQIIKVNYFQIELHIWKLQWNNPVLIRFRGYQRWCTLDVDETQRHSLTPAFKST